MIVSHVNFVSFLEKRRQGIAVRQFFSGEVPNLFLKTFNDPTGLDRAWWFM